MIDPEAQAKFIARNRKSIDYEGEALNSLQRSWELKDRECQALALADAQVWATLYLAQVTKDK